jgi:ribosomal protein L35AE/L33A
MQNRGEESRFRMEKKVVKMEKILVKMEKMEKMEKILVILEKIIVWILIVHTEYILSTYSVQGWGRGGGHIHTQDVLSSC